MELNDWCDWDDFFDIWPLEWPVESNAADEITSQQRLWMSVISMAIVDAFQSGKPYMNDVKAEARAWLTENSSDFRIVCDLAGVHSDTISSACRYIDRVGEKPFIQRHFAG